MPRAPRIAGVLILIGAVAAGSAAYADQHAAPVAPDASPGMMQQGGAVGGAGMEGMMGMMDQMNKMIALCTKMMEAMTMQMDQQNAPAKTP